MDSFCSPPSFHLMCASVKISVVNLIWKAEACSQLQSSLINGVGVLPPPVSSVCLQSATGGLCVFLYAWHCTIIHIHLTLQSPVVTIHTICFKISNAAFCIYGFIRFPNKQRLFPYTTSTYLCDQDEFFLEGTDFILKYYLDEFRLQMVNRLYITSNYKNLILRNISFMCHFRGQNV
jgi:hypothetical protein